MASRLDYYDCIKKLLVIYAIFYLGNFPQQPQKHLDKHTRFDVTKSHIVTVIKTVWEARHCWLTPIILALIGKQRQRSRGFWFMASLENSSRDPILETHNTKKRLVEW
jgi:hypothetical protein